MNDNPFDSKGILATTKTDHPSLHGLGIQNNHGNCGKKHLGTLENTYRDYVFISFAVMQNTVLRLFYYHFVQMKLISPQCAIIIQKSSNWRDCMSLYHCADFCAEKLIQHTNTPSSHKPVFRYGIELTISTLSSILSILILSLLMNATTETIVFLTTYMCLRVWCGGYHAKTYARCFLSTISPIWPFSLSPKYFLLWRAYGLL